MREDTTEALAGAIRVDGQQLTGHIDEAVRSRVEERLNGLLEADAICGAERSADGIDARAGRYGRKLQSKACEVRLKARSCAGCRLRLRSFSAIVDGKAPSSNDDVRSAQRGLRLRARLVARKMALRALYLAGRGIHTLAVPCTTRHPMTDAGTYERNALA